MQERKVSNAFAIYVAIGRIIATICSFIMPIFLTSFLSKADYGLYNQFYTILGFLGAILSFGIQSNLYYFYPTANLQSRKSIIGNTLFLIIIFGLFALFILHIPFCNDILIGDGDIKDYISIISICICLYIPTRIIAPLFVVRKDKLGSVILPPIEIISKLIIIFLVARIWGTIEAIFYGITLLQAMLLIFVCIYSLKGELKVKGTLLDISVLKQQLSYSLPFGFAVILSTFAQQFDKIVSISYLTTEEYATYALAFFGIPGILQIYDSVCQVNVVNMTQAYQDNNYDEMHRQYKDFCVKMLSFSVPIIFIVFVFSGEIIEFLFSINYLSSVPFFRIYIISIIISILGAGTILRAANKTRYTLKAYAYSSVLCIPATYLMISHFGIWGAIISCVISQIIPRLIQIYYEKKVIGTTLRQYMPWNKFIIIITWSFIGLCPVYVLKHIFHPNIFFCGIISILYIIFIYYFEIKNDLFIVNKNVISKYISKIHFNGKR